MECDNNIKRVSYSQYLNEKVKCGGKKLNYAQTTYTSTKKVHAATCQMRGKKAFMQCQLCKKHVCFKSGKGLSTISCCIDFHDDLFYGQGFMDCVEL